MLVSVVIELNNANLDQPYSYLVDFAMQKDIKIGQKVIVPFGNRDIEGFVLDIAHNYDNSNYKYIKAISKDFLNEEQLMLIKYLREHNGATMIECINTILPPALRASIKNKDKKKFIRCLRVINTKDNMSDKEKKVIQYIASKDNVTLKEVNKLFGTYVVGKLRNQNIIEMYEIEEYRMSLEINKLNYYEKLNHEQQVVVKNILKSSSNIHLIHGRTGSGKTVCYIELIKHCLENNQEVLFLVPEISLTSQIVNIISHHFDNDVAIFHSKMSSTERYDQFRKIIDKKVKIAIGTRSSIFLPFTSLGLIIIDEEHDDSYIQESKISYSTKEIAVIRSKYHGAKIILGSATPDVCTFYNTKNNKIELHVLEKSYSTSNISTEIIDMKANFDWIISKNLEDKIRKVIKKNHQFILLLNRRGYANYLICNECGEALKCPNCEVTLNLHTSNVLKCHHCSYQISNAVCDCGSSDFSEYGYGLQKIEEVLNEVFRDIKIARVDTDILTKTAKVSEIFNSFTNHEYDGLIGTQILSKGLNFTNVSLVAIIDADYMLNINSYKASEKTFQYITQSLGRNARGLNDSINLVQTYDTSHYAFVNAISNDYISFYESEIKFREKFNYPPFTKYTKIIGTSSNLSLLVKNMNDLFAECKKLHLSATKPHFSNIEKINSQYRIQILVKHSHFTKIFGIIGKVREYNKIKEVNIIINNNPIDF